MKSTMLLATSGVLFAISGPNSPSFDWQAALIVGAIVAVAAVVVIAVAIVTPFVAVEAGATMLGTCFAVGVIALATGGIGGTAAGFYRGLQGDIKRQGTGRGHKACQQPTRYSLRAVLAIQMGRLISDAPLFLTKKRTWRPGNQP